MIHKYDSVDKVLGSVDFNLFKIIGIAGGSCSGKTYFLEELLKKIRGSFISMDDYYIGVSRMKDDNFDDPTAVDLDLWRENLEDIRLGREVEKPIYDFKTHERAGHEIFKPVFPVIAEGLFAFFSSEINELYDFRIFIDSPADVRFQRRIDRDVALRGRTENEVKMQWISSVEPMYSKYVACQREMADIVILNP